MVGLLIFVAVIIWQGLSSFRKKRIEAERRREEIKRLLRLAELEAEIAEAEGVKISEERLAKEDGQRKFDGACSVCYYIPTTTTCGRCKMPRYCSGKCQVIHWRQGHKYECFEAKVATDDKAIGFVGEEVVNHHEKGGYSQPAATNYEPSNDQQQHSMPDSIINNSSDSFSFTLEGFLGSASDDDSAEEENRNPNLLNESSEHVTKEALEQSEERVRHLEEELAKSKNETSLLKSECSNWSARTSFVSRRLSSLMRKSDENQIAEQARIEERSKEDQRLRMMESELRRLKLELEEIKRSSMRKVEEVRVAERRKQEKYIQMLENAKELRFSEIKQCENIHLLEVDCVNLRRELEEERKQRLQLEQDEGLQIAKRRAERLSQELANARKNVDYAQNGWTKAVRELEDEREFVRLIKMECEEVRQSSMRQMEKKEQELADALNAAATAEAKLSDLEGEVKSLEDKACAICLTNEKDVAFSCGHMTCGDCMLTILNCHICREPITSRLKLFPG